MKQFNFIQDEEVRRLPMKLQFFAEGEGDGGANDDSLDDNLDDNKDGDDNKGGTGNQNQNKSGSTKTLTQAELNRMMKAEKDSGKRAILKELGIEDVKSTKEALTKYQEYLDSQKTEVDLAKEKTTKLEGEKTAAEKRAEYLENKFTVLELGVKVDVIDDVLILASSRVTDDKNLKQVIEEMKGSDTYTTFFTESSQDGSSKGTGHGVNSGKKGTKADGIGTRLGTSKKATQTVKSSYFSN